MSCSTGDTSLRDFYIMTLVENTTSVKFKESFDILIIIKKNFFFRLIRNVIDWIQFYGEWRSLITVQFIWMKKGQPTLTISLVAISCQKSLVFKTTILKVIYKLISGKFYEFFTVHLWCMKSIWLKVWGSLAYFLVISVLAHQCVDFNMCV